MSTEKFAKIRDTRLGVALAKIELLGNLKRSEYRASERELREIVFKLREAVDGLSKRYKLSNGPVAPEPKWSASVVPQGKAEGGASFEAEIRWAIDAINRGDAKLARNRLSRILKAEPAFEVD